MSIQDAFKCEICNGLYEGTPFGRIKSSVTESLLNIGIHVSFVNNGKINDSEEKKLDRYGQPTSPPYSFLRLCEPCAKKLMELVFKLDLENDDG